MMTNEVDYADTDLQASTVNSKTNFSCDPCF